MVHILTPLGYVMFEAIYQLIQIKKMKCHFTSLIKKILIEQCFGLYPNLYTVSFSKTHFAQHFQLNLFVQL